jgi:spore coat polysaccharide biosynthesis predicted glycosyltransferase SpsG
MNTQVEWVKQVRRDVHVISVGGSGDGRNHVTVRIDGMIPRPGYADGFQGQDLFMGPEYILLRPGFVHCPKPQTSPAIENVLICMGGDAASQGIQVAEVLAQLKPDWRLRIMVGSMAESDSTDLPDSVEIYHDVTRPWEVMKPVDLAIAAGGMTTFELLHLGIPTLLLPLNEVQLAAAKAFHDAKTAINLGLWDGTGLQARQKLAWVVSSVDFERRRSLADEGRSLVDGLGLQRVAKVIQDQLVALEK